MAKCKICKSNVRERNGLPVSKWCPSCKKTKELEKKEKHKQTKTYQKSRYKTLHKKAWTLFSQYIRFKDGAGDYWPCYTCNKLTLRTEANAGHYFHSKLDFDTRNVHFQCVSCNLYKSGNLAPYGVRLCSELGIEGMQQLRTDAYSTVYTLEDLERIIEEYTKKLNEITSRTSP